MALLACDSLMDAQLANIFDGCVRSVFRLKDEVISRPKLCYYARSGNQLDKCKMAKYRAEGITLTDLVDREQEHTWCLMKIAEPLKWERLCSDYPADVAFNSARQSAIENCERRFSVVTSPILDCFREQFPGDAQSALSPSVATAPKPAACLSFQYSRRIWKCLARKEGNVSLQRASNAYIACLRAIRSSKTSPLLMKPLRTQLIVISSHQVIADE
ncbi:hypothetical protein TYRP_015801 [Tyrophagus putrescentiae]|nr:hypothetical protein TYRP_015801 [Tyrophagus putrescentiae]